jgi:hypothetical protein
MSDSPGEEIEKTMDGPVKSAARGRATTVIAVLALLVAIGHVVYDLVRDHVLDRWLDAPSLTLHPFP